MDIPIQDDVFEIPLLAFPTFNNILREDKDYSTDAIAVLLYDSGYCSRYKTVDRSMRDLIRETFEDTHLVKFVLEQGENFITFYGTHGAVFDKDYNLLMLCTWQIKRVVLSSEAEGAAGEHRCVYKIIRPILHVDSSVYLNRRNSMERFIASKIINTCLEEGMTPPYGFQMPYIVDTVDSHPIPVKVEIGEFPFTVRPIDTPSISTTNQSLLKLALDHIEEVMA